MMGYSFVMAHKRQQRSRHRLQQEQHANNAADMATDHKNEVRTNDEDDDQKRKGEYSCNSCGDNEDFDKTAGADLDDTQTCEDNSRKVQDRKVIIVHVEDEPCTKDGQKGQEESDSYSPIPPAD